MRGAVQRGKTPNTVLTWERQVRGWSQEQVAERITANAARHGLPDVVCDVRMIRRWESGDVTWPSDRYRDLLEDLFGMPCDALGFVPRWRRQPTGERAHTRTGSCTDERGPDFVTSLLEELDALCTADNREGPSGQLAEASALLMRIGQRLARTAGPDRTILLPAAARTAEFTGWLHQDLGNLAAASYWSDKAMEWAQEAGDSLLVAYILMRKSNQASDSMDPGRALGLATAAERAFAGMPSKVHALTLRQQAHGYALLREEADCRRVLDRARACVDERHSSPEPRESLADYCTPEYIDAEAASCWVHLGHPRRAIQLLSPTVPPDAVTSRRDQGLRVARLARAHAMAGHLDQASAVGCAALTIVRDAPSLRALNELSALRILISSAGYPVATRDFQDAWQVTTTSCGKMEVWSTS